MQPMSSEGLKRFDLNGSTMGTHWHVQFWEDEVFNPAPLKKALQASVDRVDAQMSLWKPESALCRLNAARVGHWIDIPAEMMRVLVCAREIETASRGAFDIAVGGAVQAWGFGPKPADFDRVTELLKDTAKTTARAALELDPANRRARKTAPAQFDLNGIAKGFGTDRLVETAARFGIDALTAGLDGDLRCAGLRPDGSPWPIAIERPDYELRDVHSLVELTDMAVATSGDYRHWVDIGDKRYSHTMHPDLKGPLPQSPASVTVLASDCMTADAWATALMVLGREAGTAIARLNDIKAMFLEHEVVEA